MPGSVDEEYVAALVALAAKIGGITEAEFDSVTQVDRNAGYSAEVDAAKAVVFSQKASGDAYLNYGTGNETLA